MPTPGRAPDPPSDDLAPFAGRWVALLGGRVIAQAGTPQQARLAAKAHRYKEKPVVFYVPMNQPLNLPPLLTRLRALLPANVKIYLVGGTVRDILLGVTSHDYDFVVPGDALRIARNLANKMGGAYYPLDAARGTARIVYTAEDDQRIILDIADWRGKTLEDDLSARDFTLNALALDLHQPEALLDPLGGATDLQAKILRACGPTAMQQDPLRALRAIRMAATFDLRIEPETRQQMRAVTHLLPEISPERTRDELFRIFEAPRLATSLRALELLGVLGIVLPELCELKDLAQSPPHTLDAWQHTLETVRQLARLLHVLGPTHDVQASGNLSLGLAVMRLGRYRQKIAPYLRQEIVIGRSVRGLLFAAALFHDVGKPCSQQQEQAGRIRFLQHEQIGADIFERRAEALHFSNSEINWLKTVVQQHMRPTWLANQIKVGKTPSRRAVYRFFRAAGEAGPAVVLLSLADLLATYGPGIPPERWQRQLDVARALLEAYWEQYTERVSPPPLLDGNELMQMLDLKPGPKVGEILTLLKEAQAAGEVVDRQSALQFVRKMV